MSFESGIYLIEKRINHHKYSSMPKKIIVHKPVKRLEEIVQQEPKTQTQISPPKKPVNPQRYIKEQKPSNQEKPKKKDTTPVPLELPEPPLEEIIIETRPNTKLPKEYTPLKIIEPKDRTGRTYSILYDASGNPIIKTHQGGRRDRNHDDGHQQMIASYDLVKRASIFFNGYRGPQLGTNIELTQEGYFHVRKLLFKQYGKNGKKKVDKHGFSDSKYNLVLMKKEKILVIKTRIYLSDFPDINMVESELRSSEGSSKKLRPLVTTQKFNTYVYNTLLELYKNFENAFFKYNS